MNRFDELHPQYITDEKGEKTSVILPLAEFEALMEDVEDLAKVAERREEPTLSHQELLESLKRDGLL
jgi:PHD/YefM family antitoxin component YafN of YafNO toxin-antitoxin module